MSNDAKIKELVKVVEEKREKLGKKPKFVLNTGGMIKDQNGTPLNINVLTEEKVIIALSYAIFEAEAVAKAHEALGIEDKEILVQGVPFEDLKEDLTNRYKALQWDVENKKLKKLENQLKDLRSEDAKKSDALDDIADLLK